MKGQCLWDERSVFMGILFSLVLNTVVTGVEKWFFDFKMCVMKLKVRRYGMKGQYYIDRYLPL